MMMPSYRTLLIGLLVIEIVSLGHSFPIVQRQQHHGQLRTPPASMSGVDSEDQSCSPDSHDDHEPHFLFSARAARIFLPVSAAFSLATTMSANAASGGDQQFDQVRNQYFPGSLASSVMTLRLSSALRKRGYFPPNTMLATSLSSDELHYTSTSLIPNLQSKLLSTEGGVFHIPGIAGVPVATAVGNVEDMLAHSPKDGRIVLVFGPDLGISQAGVIGLVERAGQGQPTVASTFVQLNDAGSSGESPTEKTLRDKVKASGKTGDAAIVSSTDVLYDMAWDILEQRIQQALKNRPEIWNRLTELLVVGGVTVHHGHGSGVSKGENYFQPLSCRAYTQSGVTSLYDDLFGDLSTPRSRV